MRRRLDRPFWRKSQNLELSGGGFDGRAANWGRWKGFVADATCARGRQRSLADGELFFVAHGAGDRRQPSEQILRRVIGQRGRGRRGDSGSRFGRRVLPSFAQSKPKLFLPVALTIDDVLDR